MARWRPPPLPSRLEASDQVPLVGRDPELGTFEAIWPRVEAGHRQVVFVGGEPGAGKSRLAAEVATALHGHGVVVLLGTSSPEAGVPYQPFGEALDQLFLGTDSGDLEHLLGEDARQLARLSAHVHKHSPGVEGDLGGVSDVRRDLFDAVSGFLSRLCSEHPLLLVLEDLHWAQPPTLALLDHLIHICVSVPMLIVGTFRSTPPDRSDLLADKVADLHRLEGVRRLDLGGLDTESIVEYVALMAKVKPEAARRAGAILRDRTGGNPFFLRELWLDLERRGGLAALRSSHRVPASVGDSVERRLAGLGEGSRAVIELAAVTGDTFEVTTLVKAADHSQSTTLNAVDSALAVGLIQPVVGRDGVYSFVHSLTREAVVDRLPPSRVAAHHARVAESLAHESQDPSLIPRLAHHYLAAHVLGYHEQAVRYARSAGLLAEGSLAYEEAALWFERGAALPECDPSTRAEMLLAAAQNHLRAGDFPRSRAIYHQLSSASDQEVRLAAAVGYEDANWRPGLADSLPADLLTDAIAGSGLDQDDPRYVRALGSLGRALAFAGQIERAREVGSRAIDLARKLDDPATISHALKTSLWHGLAPEMAEVQLQRSTELSAMAKAATDYDTLGSAAYFRAMVSYLRGRPGDLEGALADSRLALERTGQPFFSYIYACVMQGQAFLQGDFEAAKRWAGTCLELGDYFDHQTEGSYGVQMFLTSRQVGELDRLRAYVDGNESFNGRWIPGLLALYTELEIEPGIRRSLRQLLNRDLPAQTADAQWPMVLVFMVEGALAVGDTEALETLRPFLTAFEGMNVVAGQFVAPFGSADRYLGRIAALDGDVQTAERHFTVAAEMDRRMGAITHLAETLAYHALSVAGFGDGERAAALAQEARSLAEPIGQARVLKVIDSLQPAGMGHDGLTEREVEVLRLLAAGLSNREIGERLFISTNTAANHVRNILMKTGTGNRTQAAIYATERHLV